MVRVHEPEKPPKALQSLLARFLLAGSGGGCVHTGELQHIVNYNSSHQIHDHHVDKQHEHHTAQIRGATAASGVVGLVSDVHPPLAGDQYEQGVHRPIHTGPHLPDNGRGPHPIGVPECLHGHHGERVQDEDKKSGHPGENLHCAEETLGQDDELLEEPQYLDYSHNSNNAYQSKNAEHSQVCPLVSQHAEHGVHCTRDDQKQVHDVPPLKDLLPGVHHSQAVGIHPEHEFQGEEQQEDHIHHPGPGDPTLRPCKIRLKA
mmetsp:Transcript_20470/g.51943  ORF Transcript_20470/g.51943 Transcript_20470/m.51943 type:complete len:260 (-) Transcript_20470:683-1462(-)